MRFFGKSGGLKTSFQHLITMTWNAFSSMPKSASAYLVANLSIFKKGARGQWGMALT